MLLLESRGKPTEAIREGSVKHVNFYDDDVRFWQLWCNRARAAEAPSTVSHVTSALYTQGRGKLSIWHEGYEITYYTQLARRYTGGHKGAINCLMTFMASSGED
ncbi:Phosphoribosylglycinamide formyltransferase chloroplastic [Bienertia sinuspersici]